MKRHSRRSQLSIQQLETREMPATLVSPTTVTYQDEDGDDVKVVFSKPILSPANVNKIFKFVDLAGAEVPVDGNNQTKQLLAIIDITNKAPDGTSISVTARTSPTNGGSAFAIVGAVVAVGIDLGTVRIEGDLTSVMCGDPVDSTPGGLGALVVDSFGAAAYFNGVNQILPSIVIGNVGSITSKMGVYNVWFTAMNHMANSGRIGRIVVGESIETDVSGQFNGFSAQSIGSVVVEGSVLDSVFTAGSPAAISPSTGLIGSIKIGGDFNGQIAAQQSLGMVQIGGNVGEAALIGGANRIAGVQIKGDFQGTIKTVSAGPIRIGGDMKGGTLQGAGVIHATRASSIDIGGDLVGGVAHETGMIQVTKANSIRIGGDVVGGQGRKAGSIFSTDLGSLTIGGSLKGGDNTHAFNQTVEYSGHISGGSIRRLTINEAIVSGKAFQPNYYVKECGSISVRDNLGTVTIGRIDGTSAYPVRIQARGQSRSFGPIDLAIGSLTVLGDAKYGLIIAGNNPEATLLDGAFTANADAQIGRVTVGGNWEGSSLVAGVDSGDGRYGNVDDAKFTGEVKDVAKAKSKIGPVTIRGSVIATANVGDSYGIMAEQVVSVKVGPTLIKLNAGASNDNLLVDPASDLWVKEV